MNPYNKNITLGILGGLGPMSSAYFYELVTEHTCAECDQDHIDIILSSRASTPDRTAFITGGSNDNPLFAMKEEAMKLISVGVDVKDRALGVNHRIVCRINTVASGIEIIASTGNKNCSALISL